MNEQYKVNGVQYRLQRRKCGKPGCKCNNPGQEHGPYWYSYDGNSAAKYVGGKLPEHVTKHVELLKASKAKIKKVRADIQKQRDNLYQQYRRADKQLDAISALEAGEHVDSGVLIDIGLAQFNGYGGKHVA